MCCEISTHSAFVLENVVPRFEGSLLEMNRCVGVNPLLRNFGGRAGPVLLDKTGTTGQICLECVLCLAPLLDKSARRSGVGEGREAPGQ